jgi:hypothetical protein
MIRGDMIFTSRFSITVRASHSITPAKWKSKLKWMEMDIFYHRSNNIVRMRKVDVTKSTPAAENY